MTAIYTFDVFSSLDGYGAATANWSGYWGKQGAELLERRLSLYGAEQRMVFGANTYREFAQMLADSTEDSEVRDRSSAVRSTSTLSSSSSGRWTVTPKSSSTDPHFIDPLSSCSAD